MPRDSAAAATPDDALAWFNLGSDLVALGQFEPAAAAYDRARQIGLPWRMLWYQFGPYESYHAVGRYDDVIALADTTLATANNLEESYYWRGMSRLAQGDVEQGISELKSAVDLGQGLGHGEPAADDRERVATCIVDADGAVRETLTQA